MCLYGWVIIHLLSVTFMYCLRETSLATFTRLWTLSTMCSAERLWYRFLYLIMFPIESSSFGREMVSALEAGGYECSRDTVTDF